MNPLLIVGSVAIDTIRTPQGDASDQLGGSAVFAALTARHWVKPVVLSAIGGDFPMALEAKMETAGVELGNLTRVANEKSFRWEGVYDAGLGTRETIGLDLGVMATAKLAAPDLFAIKFAMMGNYHPARELEIMDKLPEGCFVAADTIQAWIRYELAALTELFRRANIICIDGNELLEFTQGKNEAAGVEKLFELGPRWAIIKYGKRGSRLYGREGERATFGIYDNVPKDTTGAGDTFLAAIMAHVAAVGRADFETLKAGIRLGTAAASITTEAFGVDAIIEATGEEIEKRTTGVE